MLIALGGPLGIHDDARLTPVPEDPDRGAGRGCGRRGGAYRGRRPARPGTRNGNGTRDGRRSSLDESVETVTYWHVELDSHDLLVAEGVAADSYLDLGNRGFFAGVAIGPDEAVPGGRATRAQNCRPFAEGDSAIVAFARQRLRARAVALGWTTQPAPVAGLHAVADGHVIAPSVDGTTVSFQLPTGCGDVWLGSETTVPALVTESDDHRRLGVNLRGLTIDDGVAAPLKVRLDDARLGAGFHSVPGKAEAPYRWTRGEALLPASLWANCTGPVTLRLELGGERLLRWRAPDRRVGGVELAERRRA